MTLDRIDSGEDNPQRLQGHLRLDAIASPVS